jgi:glycosyltransferase involved in cell wall biosynthesis
MEHPLTILCLAHLKWSHVWQRPQQLMSRFTRHCRVIYVDPPDIKDVEAPHMLDHGIDQGVHLREPIFPAALLDTPGNNFRELWLRLLPGLLDEAGPNTVVWVLSPLLSYLVEAALPRVELAVYDCMDDLASFRDGTAEIREREAHMMEMVDLVFTGGFSMYEARKDRHPRAHCFPSGVDVAHFQRVADCSVEPPPPIAWIPRPRLGYFGVLDERIDWKLIAELAYKRRDWHWVLVGPTAKVRPSEIPGGTNIHYLGQRPYAELPAYLKGFDIATMPFALSEATRYISPTKTPEYLAGGKPVISTSVPDVVAGYKDIISIADGVEGWLTAVEELLSAAPEHSQTQLERARPRLEAASWDSITERMWELIQERLCAKA